LPKVILGVKSTTDRGRQIANSNRCRLTPLVIKFRR
jgi:hypothetical protein